MSILVLNRIRSQSRQIIPIDPKKPLNWFEKIFLIIYLSVGIIGTILLIGFLGYLLIN